MKVKVKAKSRWDMRDLYDDIIAVVQDNGQGISATEDWDDVHMLRHEQ